MKILAVLGIIIVVFVTYMVNKDWLVIEGLIILGVIMWKGK